MNKTLIAFLLAAAGIGVLPAPVLAQETYHGGSIDARQHGYEHGYRDGYEYGRDVRVRGGALDFRTDAYREADQGYRPFLGPRDAYRDGYREGYQNGAEDAYRGVQTRLEEIYGWRDRDFDPDRVRDDRAVTVYHDRHFEYMDVATDVGYRDGLNSGLKDFREHHSYRVDQHDAWKDADHGYSSAFGRKEDYKTAYRAAYERGYRDGYGR